MTTPSDSDRKEARMADDKRAGARPMGDTPGAEAKAREPDVCPFCGERPALYEDGWHSTGYWVECLNRECHVTPSVWGKSEREAIAAWNRRAPAALAAPLTEEEQHKIAEVICLFMGDECPIKPFSKHCELADAVFARLVQLRAGGVEAMTPRERAERLANWMARHIIGTDFAAEDEACGKCIKAAEREITEAIDAQRERDAKIADDERDCAATDAYDDRQALGAQYDPNCYGTGYDAGRKAAAEQIAAAIRSQCEP